MKKTLTLLAALFIGLSLMAQRTPDKVKYVYTEASDLNLIGKILPTPNPYHRVDTVKYKGFTKGENKQVRSSAGLAVVFRTNSSSITIRAEGDLSYASNSTMRLASHGYDLYIKDGKRWLWAGATAPNISKPEATMTLIKNMAPGMKECLLYLPIYCDMQSIRIGVEEGAVLEAIESPFRHRVAIFGSSYTHGISTSRAGMSYPMQFTRHTGIQMLSLGCSGKCKMQPYSLQALEAVDAEAFIFDTFSNPSIAEIRERLFPFIERLQAAHPGVPLIFQRTIYREGRNFDKGAERAEQGRIDVADSLMAIACKRYKDVYYIHPNATEKDHETSVDGIHPSDHGYGVWAQSIERQVLRILRHYGIR